MSYLPATSNAPYFSTKNESVIILKIKNFYRKNLPIVHDVRKVRFIFL